MISDHRGTYQNFYCQPVFKFVRAITKPSQGASNAHGNIFFLPNQLIRATESCLFIWVLKISKSFSEIVMSRALTRGLKLLKIGIFHENRLFSVEIFLYSTTSMLCHIPLERSANTEKNGI